MLLRTTPNRCTPAVRGVVRRSRPASVLLSAILSAAPWGGMRLADGAEPLPDLALAPGVAAATAPEAAGMFDAGERRTGLLSLNGLVDGCAESPERQAGLGAGGLFSSEEASSAPATPPAGTWRAAFAEADDGEADGAMGRVLAAPRPTDGILGGGEGWDDLPPAGGPSWYCAGAVEPQAGPKAEKLPPSAYAPGAQRVSLEGVFSVVTIKSDGEMQDDVAFFSAVQFSYGYVALERTELGLSARCPQMATSDGGGFYGLLDAEIYVRYYFPSPARTWTPCVTLHGGVCAMDSLEGDAESGPTVGLGVGLEKALSATTSLLVQFDFAYARFDDDESTTELLTSSFTVGMGWRF